MSCLSNGTCYHVSSYNKKEKVMPVTIYRIDQQISHCHPIERAYGSECTFLYWLSLMVLKVQSLTLSEWQIGMVLGLGRSQHTQAINSCPPRPPHHLAVGTLSLWWELWVINCQWMTCMNNGQVKLIPHTSSAVWGSGALRERRFSQVEWFQFSLGDNSCSIMEQCTQVTKTQWNNEKWWCPFWVSASLVLLEKY